MPTLVNPEDMKTSQKGDGWMVITLADAETFNAPSMVARRWVFEPGAQGPEVVHGDTDQLLYVIGGSGTALVEGEELPLTQESVLWLEPGDRYQFTAAANGLEILQGYAPGE